MRSRAPNGALLAEVAPLTPRPGQGAPRLHRCVGQFLDTGKTSDAVFLCREGTDHFLDSVRAATPAAFRAKPHPSQTEYSAADEVTLAKTHADVAQQAAEEAEDAARNAEDAADMAEMAEMVVLGINGLASAAALGVAAVSYQIYCRWMKQKRLLARCWVAASGTSGERDTEPRNP